MPAQLDHVAGEETQSPRRTVDLAQLALLHRIHWTRLRLVQSFRQEQDQLPVLSLRRLLEDPAFTAASA